MGSFVLMFRVPPSTGKHPWACRRGLDAAAMAERRATEDIIVPVPVRRNLRIMRKENVFLFPSVVRKAAVRVYL